MTIQNFWLKQSKLIHWHKRPSFAFKKKNNNFVEWYPDGKVNIFHNSYFSASEFINRNWDNIHDWWASDIVQKYKKKILY